MTTDLAAPRTALAIAAHPDDVEFNCGATLSKWSKAGCEVSYLICTDGSKGTWDTSADPAELAARRQTEQNEAHSILGATGEVRFLGVADGELQNTREMRYEIARHIRELKPAVVFGHDPWKRYRLHPDHRAAGYLVTDGVVAARDPHFFPELGLQHFRPETILLFEAEAPDHFESITYEDLGRRIAALEAHESQFETTHLAPFAELADPLGAFREDQLNQVSSAGEQANLKMAEAFKLLIP